MTAHSSLTGLTTGDDHTQYLRKDLADAKGDLFVASADNVLGRLPVGTNGQVLSADSAQSLGVKWVDYPWISSDLVKVDQPITSSAPTVFVTTADAVSHTKGAYTDLIASTAGACTMIRVTLFNTFTTATATSNLVDIATGTAGNEVVIAANLDAGFLDTQGMTYWLPLAVPSGTRISARSQGLISGDTVSVLITTWAGTNKTATVDTLGAVTASSQGTAVAAGTSNAEGSWTQIIASTAATYTGLLWGVGGAADTTILSTNALLDIGVGAAASEAAVISDIWIQGATDEHIVTTSALPIYPVSIASGSRIAARIQSSGAAQSFDVILYGLR